MKFKNNSYVLLLSIANFLFLKTYAQDYNIINIGSEGFDLQLTPPESRSGYFRYMVIPPGADPTPAEVSAATGICGGETQYQDSDSFPIRVSVSCPDIDPGTYDVWVALDISESSTMVQPTKQVLIPEPLPTVQTFYAYLPTETGFSLSYDIDHPNALGKMYYYVQPNDLPAPSLTDTLSCASGTCCGSYQQTNPAPTVTREIACSLHSGTISPDPSKAPSTTLPTSDPTVSFPTEIPTSPPTSSIPTVDPTNIPSPSNPTVTPASGPSKQPATTDPSNQPSTTDPSATPTMTPLTTTTTSLRILRNLPLGSICDANRLCNPMFHCSKAYDGSNRCVCPLPCAEREVEHECEDLWTQDMCARDSCCIWIGHSNAGICEYKPEIKCEDLPPQTCGAFPCDCIWMMEEGGQCENLELEYAVAANAVIPEGFYPHLLKEAKPQPITDAPTEQVVDIKESRVANKKILKLAVPVRWDIQYGQKYRIVLYATILFMIGFVLALWYSLHRESRRRNSQNTNMFVSQEGLVDYVTLESLEIDD